MSTPNFKGYENYPKSETDGLNHQVSLSLGVQNLKNKADGHSTIDENGDRTNIDWATYATVGIETLSEGNLETANERTASHALSNIKDEGLVDMEHSQGKNSEGDDVTEFLMEINKLNNNLLARKRTIKELMAELHKELEVLNESQNTPMAIVSYINNQRNLRERVLNALRTGSTKFDSNTSINQLPPLGISNTNEDDMQVNRKVPPNEVVFLTQKTEGYKKEQEKLQQQKERKRDQKYREKWGDLIQDFGYDGYYNTDEPIPGYLDNGQNMFHLHHNGIYGLDNLNHGEYDNYENYYGKNNKRFSSIFINERNNENKDAFQNSILPEVAIIDKTFNNQSSDKNLISDKSKNGDRQSNIFNGIPESNFSNKDLQGNCELIGKVEGTDLLPYDELAHPDGNDFLQNSHPGNQKDVKKEIDDTSSDLFDNQSDEETKHNIKSIYNNNRDIFDDCASQISINHHETNKNIFEASNGKISETHGDPNFSRRESHESTNQLRLHQLENMNQNYMGSGYMHEPLYLNHPDAIGHYDPAYAMDPRINGLYPEVLYQPMHPDLVKMEDGLGPYYHGPSGVEASGYYKMHSNKYEDTKETKASAKHSANRGRKRNKYRMLPTEVKIKAVELAKQKNQKYAAQIHNVPLKSLKRWMKVGWERKKGGGRKTKDPIMEKNLYEWYKDKKKMGEPVTAKMIKEKAMDLTNCNDFIASKGWLDKFKVRFNLDISKESNKDGHKRRSTNDLSKKDRRKYDASLDIEPFYNNNDMHNSFRRSINKSVKQEFNDYNDFKQETNSKEENSNGIYKVKEEHWPEKKQNRNAYKSKSEIPSILQPFRKDGQTRSKKLIEDPSSNVISIPLYDGNNSDLDFSN